MSHTQHLTPGYNYSIPWHECTLQTCPMDRAVIDYRPSIPLNSLLLALFSLSLVANIIQGIAWRTWGFLIAMLFGNMLEVMGYSARIWANRNPFSLDAFLMQICCLTIAPAFIAAGIYLCLSRIIVVFGVDTSRIPPKAYTYIFITCDFISLCLQGAGGGIASVRSQNDQDPALGNNIMLAGLSFQVFTLALFITLCAEYAYRVSKATGYSLDPVHAKLRRSKRFMGFLIALALATVTILVRSIYRVVEMAQGWNGELIKNEKLFFVLEGVMVVVAVLVLNGFHPGWCFREGYEDRRKDRDGEKGSERSSVRGGL